MTITVHNHGIGIGNNAPRIISLCSIDLQGFVSGVIHKAANLLERRDLPRPVGRRKHQADITTLRSSLFLL